MVALARPQPDSADLLGFALALRLVPPFALRQPLLVLFSFAHAQLALAASLALAVGRTLLRVSCEPLLVPDHTICVVIPPSLSALSLSCSCTDSSLDVHLAPALVVDFAAHWYEAKAAHYWILAAIDQQRVQVATHRVLQELALDCQLLVAQRS